ncbi:MAG: DUF4845 domain-containing protein [Pseudomonadota bacterium]
MKTLLNVGTRQRGMGMWGWLMTIALIASSLTVVLRLGPHYIDFQMVEGVLDRLDPIEVHKRMSKSDITEHFQKQFRVENFRYPVKDLLKINRDRDQTELNINYEIREPLVYNIDVVLVFSTSRTYR